MNNRLNLKFEYDGLEQGYRYFLGNGIEGPTDIVKMVDEGFLANVDRTFGLLQKTRFENLPHSLEDGFDEII